MTSGVLRVQLARLSTELGSLRKLADSLRDEVSVKPEVSNGFGDGGNVIVHNAALLRKKNRRALYAVDAVISDLEKLARDLDTAAGRAGVALADADHDGGDGVRGAGD